MSSVITNYGWREYGGGMVNGECGDWYARGRRRFEEIKYMTETGPPEMYVYDRTIR